DFLIRSHCINWRYSIQTMDMATRSFLWLVGVASLVVFCAPDEPVIPMTGNTQTPSTPSPPSDTPDLMTYLALGDSYTIGESVPESGRWPVQLVKEINSTSQYKFGAPRIIARTGWRTDQLKQAIQTENPPKDYDLVSLLIGVNNQYQGQPVENYVSAFEELLQI